MNPFIIFLLLAAIIIAEASYMPTESPAQWRQRMMQTRRTLPSWVPNPINPTKWPGYYSEIAAQKKEREQLWREEQEKEHNLKKEASDDDIDVEKRRNLLVGRYGFRIGKRNNEDEITEEDYQELLDQQFPPVKTGNQRFIQ